MAHCPEANYDDSFGSVDESRQNLYKNLSKMKSTKKNVNFLEFDQDQIKKGREENLEVMR